MKRRYGIEIYEPGSDTNPAGYFESDTPFMAIQPGALVHPIGMDDNAGPGDLWVVTRTEHVLWTDRQIARQKIMVYTRWAKRGAHRRGPRDAKRAAPMRAPAKHRKRNRVN